MAQAILILSAAQVAFAQDYSAYDYGNLAFATADYNYGDSEVGAFGDYSYYQYGEEEFGDASFGDYYDGTSSGDNAFYDYSYGEDDAEIFEVTTTTTSTTTTTEAPATTAEPRKTRRPLTAAAVRGMGGAGDGTGDYRFCLKCEGETLADCVAKQNAATGTVATGYTGYEDCDKGGEGDDMHKFQTCFSTLRVDPDTSTTRVWSGCSSFSACNSLMNQNFDINHPRLSQCRPPAASSARFRIPSTCTFCTKLAKGNGASIDGVNEIWHSAAGELNYSGNPSIFDLINTRETGLGAVGAVDTEGVDSVGGIGQIYQDHGTY